MSSILSTQNRHIFLRRKNCFLPPKALSPPVGRWDALIGLPPLCSAMTILLLQSSLRGPLLLLPEQPVRVLPVPVLRASDAPGLPGLRPKAQTACAASP